jgi:hypothetical protein
MQRKVVTLHLSISEDGKLKNITVEARCVKCAYWKQDSRVSFHDMGNCCRFPREHRKHTNDWCGEFVPE